VRDRESSKKPLLHAQLLLNNRLASEQAAHVSAFPVQVVQRGLHLWQNSEVPSSKKPKGQIQEEPIRSPRQTVQFALVLHSSH
jgi:hypothetical protein